MTTSESLVLYIFSFIFFLFLLFIPYILISIFFNRIFALYFFISQAAAAKLIAYIT